MNELMTVNTINALSNKELKTNLKVMYNALETGKKATWNFAKACTDIIKGEQFKDDFKTAKDFSAFVNVTSGAMSQMVKAVDFVTREGLVSKDKKGKLDYGTVTIPVYNAYLLSVLSEDEYDSFVEWCEGQEINHLALSQVNLKKALADWKESLVVDTIATESEAESEAESEEVSIKVDTKEKALTAIITLMQQFNITLDEIENQM